MDKLIFCVRWFLVFVCFEGFISLGDSCECDAIIRTFSNEIVDLKIENVKLTSRIETIESMLRERKEMQPSFTEKGAANLGLLDEEQARLEQTIEENRLMETLAFNNILHRALRAETKERWRSELKIEEGLGRLNTSLKEFDEQATAFFMSHENTISHAIQVFEKTSTGIVGNITNDVLSIVENLESQTDDMLNSGTEFEKLMEHISQNISRMEVDISSVIDIVLLDQKTECEPNCKNEGVCFMDGSCRCKLFTDGSHCERFFCTDGCIENGGECEGPGLCSCPEGQYGYNCENKGCVLPVNAANNGSTITYKIGEILNVLCEAGYGLSPHSVSEVICQALGQWSGTVECVDVIDECAPQPCIHGSCSDGIGEYTCSCFTGYSGQNCDTGCGGIVSRYKETCGDNLGRKLSLWVKKVTGFSSQYNNDTWSANNVIGCPGINPSIGGTHGAWEPYVTGRQYIEVEFDVKVNVTGIDIYEKYIAGAVVAILGLHHDGTWRAFWKSDTPYIIKSSRKFSPSLDVKDFSSSTKALRIEFDAGSKSWVAIDAFRLHGCAQK